MNMRWRNVNERNLDDFEQVALTPTPIDIIENLVIANLNPTNPVALRHIFETHMTWTNEIDLNPFKANARNSRKPTFPHGSRDVVDSSSSSCLDQPIPSLLSVPHFRQPEINQSNQFKRKANFNFKRGKRARFSTYGKGRQNNQQNRF